MGKNKKSSKKKQKYTVDDLLDRVSEYVDCFQFDLAAKFCEKALQLEPSNPKVLETAGNVYADIGDTDNSVKCFLKAVEIQPDCGHEKYMYLGQMSAGSEAKAYYLKGIEIMKSCLETACNGNNAAVASNAELARSVTLKDISNAYCALAEIYLTDSCEDEGAEENCGNFCKLAIDTDKTNPDAYIVMANFLLSKEDKAEASKVLLSCFDLLNFDKSKPAESIDLEEEATDNNDNNMWEDQDDNENEQNEALYASKVMLAKLLTEVAEYEKTDIVLTALLEANDEDIEIWYMLGWNMFLQNQLAEARVLLSKASELYEKLQHQDEPLLEHIKELLDKCPAAKENNFEGGDEEMEVE
eukprot:gene17636-19390_t